MSRPPQTPPHPLRATFQLHRATSRLPRKWLSLLSPQNRWSESQAELTLTWRGGEGSWISTRAVTVSHLPVATEMVVSAVSTNRWSESQAELTLTWRGGEGSWISTRAATVNSSSCAGWLACSWLPALTPFLGKLS